MPAKPLTDPSARKIRGRPEPPPAKARPLRTVVTLDPSAELIETVAYHLLPITPEEITYRGLGESPLLPGLTAIAQLSLTFGLMGAVSLPIFSFFAGDPELSFRRALKSGVTSGLQMGAELGISQLLELEIACARGRPHVIDKVVSGVTAGLICGAPGGLQGMKRGAMRGALTSVAFGLVDLAVRPRTAETRGILEWDRM